MTKIKELITLIEKKYPLQVQESYDNSGLITGNVNDEITGVLLTIDITEKVVDEAVQKGFNLIIAHHPIIFKPLKRLTGKNHIERTIISAIKNDIAIYAAHTSVDNSDEGLNKIICDKLGVKNTKIILPKPEILHKLVTFVPIEHADKVREAIFKAGAGNIGNYDNCSYNIDGVGTFRAGENTNAFAGKKGEIHFEKEVRIETVFPSFIKGKVISTLKNTHPYEEVAYDIYPLANKFEKFGAGIIGELEQEIDEIEFLKIIKEKLEIKSIRYSDLMNKKIKKVAICTGACSFLMDRIVNVADIFISSEFKYNHFIEAQNRILIVDAGHYETEVFIKNLFYEYITKNFTNFAVEFSQNFSNPVNYF